MSRRNRPDLLDQARCLSKDHASLLQLSARAHREDERALNPGNYLMGVGTSRR